MTEEMLKGISIKALQYQSYDVFNYSSYFTRLAEASTSGSDTELLGLYRTITGVCGFHFQPAQPSPFAPMFQMEGKRSMTPDDLSDDQLNQLKKLTEQNLPSAIMARFCDVLWLRRKDYIRARKAISAYMECTEKGYVEHWPRAIDCARRATRIANELGRKAEERQAVKIKLESLFEDAVASPNKDGGWHWLRALAEVLIEECDAVNCAEMGDKCQVLGGAVADVWTKADYFQLAADAFKKANLSDKRREAFRLLGQSWESDANKFCTPDGGEGMQIAYRLEKAIEAYRHAGDRDKAEQLLRDLQQANKLTINQMKPIQVNIDMTKHLKTVEQRMADKQGMQAVEAFMRLCSPNSYTSVYQAAETEAQTPRIQKFAVSTSLVEEGNIVARSEGGLKAGELDVQKELVNSYARTHSVAAPLLEHARKIILQDKTEAWVPAIDKLIQRTAFVSDGRHDIFSRAIIAGMRGDFILFTYLVIPQIENSVRLLVGKVGGKTTTLRDGLMMARNLNQLLTEEDPGKDVYAVLGKDITWELRALLVEHSGPNFRNRVCHGLAMISECTGPSAIYLLWLVLFLVAYFPDKVSAHSDKT